MSPGGEEFRARAAQPASVRQQQTVRRDGDLQPATRQRPARAGHRGSAPATRELQVGVVLGGVQQQRRLLLREPRTRGADRWREARRAGRRTIADDGSMPGPLRPDRLRGRRYAALVVLLAAYSAFRWRERPPWLDSMAWMLEFLLVVRALSGSARWPAAIVRTRRRPTSATWSPRSAWCSRSPSVAEDRGPWSIAVLAIAVVAVAVISIRMMVTL